MSPVEDSAPTGREPVDVQGHRGARGLLPENSLPGFLRALELGVTTLEMDVVVSRDRQVVVSHDPFFSSVICRQPDGRRIASDEERRHALFDLDYNEIAAYDCGSIRHPDFPGQALRPTIKPLLAQVFEMAEDYVVQAGRPPVWYNIETKSTPAGDGTLHPAPEEFTRLLLDQVNQFGLADRVIVQSFDPRTLRVALSSQTPVRLSLLVSRRHDHGVEANVERLGFVPHVYSPDYRLVDTDLAARCKKLRMQLIPWTVNEPADMERLLDLGVRGFISDYPDVAIAVTSRR